MPLARLRLREKGGSQSCELARPPLDGAAERRSAVAAGVVLCPAVGERGLVPHSADSHALVRRKGGGGAGELRQPCECDRRQQLASLDGVLAEVAGTPPAAAVFRGGRLGGHGRQDEEVGADDAHDEARGRGVLGQGGGEVVCRERGRGGARRPGLAASRHVEGVRLAVFPELDSPQGGVRGDDDDALAVSGRVGRRGLGDGRDAPRHRGRGDDLVGGGADARGDARGGGCGGGRVDGLGDRDSARRALGIGGPAYAVRSAADQPCQMGRVALQWMTPAHQAQVVPFCDSLRQRLDRLAPGLVCNIKAWSDVEPVSGRHQRDGVRAVRLEDLCARCADVPTRLRPGDWKWIA